MTRREAQRLLDRDLALRKFIGWCHEHDRDTQDRTTLAEYCDAMRLGRAEGRRVVEGAAALAMILRGETRETLAMALLGAVQTCRREATEEGGYKALRTALGFAKLEADMLGLRSKEVRLVGDKQTKAAGDPSQLSDEELEEALREEAEDDYVDPDWF